MSDMIKSYETACAEDIGLEAAMTVFGKKKQLLFAQEQLQKNKANTR